jgi:NADH:ubiquinone oxidoreductase subunit K
MALNNFLILSAFLFCTGIYGVLARKNAVLVLMSVELMLNAVNINLVAFSAFKENVTGQIFALFIITIAAAEVGVGLAIVLLIYRNLHSPDLDEVDQLKG